MFKIALTRVQLLFYWLQSLVIETKNESYQSQELSVDIICRPTSTTYEKWVPKIKKQAVVGGGRSRPLWFGSCKLAFCITFVSTDRLQKF